MFRQMFMAAVVFAALPFTLDAQTPGVEAYAAAPAAWGVELSNDGSHIAMGCSPGGLRTVCILDLSGGEAPIVYPTPDGARINDFYWANDRFLIISVNFTTSMNGVNRGDPFRVDRAISFDTQERSSVFLMSNYRNITNTANVVSLDLDDPEQVLIQVTFLVDDEVHLGSNLGTQADYETHLMRVDLSDGRGRRYRASGGSVIGYLVDPDGEVAGRLNYDDDSRRFAVYLGGREVYSDTSGVDRPSVWLMDGGEAVGLRFASGADEGLYRVDRETRQREPLMYNGQSMAGAGAIRDRWTAEMVGFSFYRDHLSDQAFIDGDLEGVRTALNGAMGGARVRLLSWSENRRVFAFVAESPGTPRVYYIYNRDSGEVSLIESAAPQLDGVALGAVTPFTFAASDGMQISGYLTLPPGHAQGDGRVPLVVMPHGGPASRDTAGFDWWAQYFASIGYGVAQVNFRGSDGLGASYREAGYGGFGTRMVDDIADAAAWLEQQGIAAPGGYCTIGASYGGYASLMLAVRDADDAACVVAVNAVTEPITLFDRVFQEGNDFWEQYIGSRHMSSTESAALSPVRRAAEITAPVLLIWTDEDTTVPPEQSLALVRAMEDQGNISGYVIPGEDHYLGATVARQQVLEQSAAFIREHHPVQ